MLRFEIDAVLADGSIVSGSQPLIARTTKANKNISIVGGKHPRVVIARPVLFEQNKAGALYAIMLW